MNDMFSTGITPHDYWMMAVGGWKTIQMTLVAGLLATVLGVLLGLLKMTSIRAVRIVTDALVDILRCIPLLVQVTLIFAFFAVLGAPISAFMAGTIALTLFSGGYISEVVKDAIASVPVNLRRASRGLGMTRRQEYLHIVMPLGVRQAFPTWLGLMLGIVKDTSVVAVVGYTELLKATQTIITRTQDPLPLLSLAACFYFFICFPLSMVGSYFERSLKKRS